VLQNVLINISSKESAGKEVEKKSNKALSDLHLIFLIRVTLPNLEFLNDIRRV
jgi:hypothetical protein